MGIDCFFGYFSCCFLGFFGVVVIIICIYRGFRIRFLGGSFRSRGRGGRGFIIVRVIKLGSRYYFWFRF